MGFRVQDRPLAGPRSRTFSSIAVPNLFFVDNTVCFIGLMSI